MSKHLTGLLTILLFSLIGMKALFHPGLFTAHDIWHQVVRFYYYSQAIYDGQFPPYWIGQLANGFGYPLFFFSYHLPWLLGTPLLKVGLDIPSVIKSLFFLSYLGSGITMYFLVHSLLKSRLSAILSAILYLWLPYHFLIIFVGGSIGIAFIFTFLPMFFLGIHLLKERPRLGIPILAIGLSGLILSHIMHLVFLSPAIFIFFVWTFLNNKSKFLFLKRTFLGILLGLFIASFYLLPAAYYSQFTKVKSVGGLTEIYKRHFIDFKQLVYSKWGYSPIVNNAKNGEISFQLGFAQWFSILALFCLIITKRLSKFYQGLSISLLLTFLISVSLMLDFSKFFWVSAVKIFIVDFPFRLLLPATFIASICAGVVLLNLKGSFRNLVFIFLVSTAIYTNRNHVNVNQYTNFPISDYLSLETEITTNTFNEYLPLETDSKLLGKPWNEIVGENMSASNLKSGTNFISFDLDVSKRGIASIGQLYFPGQNLYLNNKSIQFIIDKKGKIQLEIPKGKHKVAVKYQETPLIKISKVLTIIGIAAVFYLLINELQLFKNKFYS